MIQNERASRHEHVLDVARQMMTAARTAPKQAVWQAIQDYREAGFDEWSQDLIDREVMKLKTAIEQLDLAIEDQNHAIETAQRNLDGYNNGNLTALQTAKEELEDAEAAMVAAQEVYNDALDALNKMIAAMAAEVAE